MVKIKKYKGTMSTTEVVDSATGEIITVENEKTYSFEVNKDEFYMTYIDFIAPFFNLKSAVAKSLMVALCMKSDFNDGRVYLVGDNRAEIAKLASIPETNLSKYLKELVDNNLIAKLSRGTYRINPQIFWKGENKARVEQLKSNEIQVMFKINPSLE